MTIETLYWLAECALRSSAVALAAGVFLFLFRVKNAAFRSAVWTAVLLASVLMPLCSAMLPALFVYAPSPVSASPVEIPVALLPDTTTLSPVAGIGLSISGLLAPLYLAVASILLLRVVTGLAVGLRIRRASALVEGFEHPVRESSMVNAPATFGLLRPFVLLPSSWREWDPRKLNAVILHEYAHVDRRDFAVQLLASVHAALFWFSPVSWWLRGHLAALAEQASDDQVIGITGDRVYYAELLLGFLGQHRVPFQAVGMARESGAAERIELILDEGRKLSGSVPFGASAMLGLMGSPLLYLASSVSLAQAPPPPPAPPPAVLAAEVPAPPAPPQTPVTPRAARTAKPIPPTPPAPPSSGARSGSRNNILDIEDDSIHFKQDGKWYVITDKATIVQAKSFHEPLRQLGEQQRTLGEQQRAMGEEQRKAGEKMRGASVAMPDMEAAIEKVRKAAAELRAKQFAGQNELGKLQSEMGKLQSELSKLQHEAGKGQSEIGREMSKIGEHQNALGKKQAELGRQQSEAGRKAGEAIRQLLDAAIKDGRAKETF